MGRGRAKAKQTKVARDLKYRSQDTDFDALANELHGGAASRDDSAGDRDGNDVDDADEWSDRS